MPWELTNHSAIGFVGTAKIELVPADPRRFATISLPDKTTVRWEVFAITPLPNHSAKPEEIYARENDLIARFRQSDSDAYAFQLDWRLLAPEPPFVAGVELWLSIQTDLLDTEPQIEVACQPSAEHAWQCFDRASLLGDDIRQRSLDGSNDPAAMLCQANGTSGCWLVEPSDQGNIRIVSKSGDALLRTRLFGHFMEKGVIRRARLRFLVAPCPVKSLAISDAYRDFALSPLPLTA